MRRGKSSISLPGFRMALTYASQWRSSVFYDRCVATLCIRVDFDPRPDYARKSAELHETTAGLEVHGAARPLHLATNCPIPYVVGRRQFVLDQPLFFALTWGPPSEPRTMASVLHDLERTITGWRAWSKCCSLPTFSAAAVLRSALCLKLHAYHDTGAIIAAATTSIPEAMGTPRTWDYRYCWLRDSAFVVEACAVWAI